MKKLLFAILACSFVNVAVADIPSCISIDAINSSLHKPIANNLSKTSFVNSLYRETNNGAYCITPQNVYSACHVGYTIHQIAEKQLSTDEEFRRFLDYELDTDAMLDFCKDFIYDVLDEHNALIKNMKNPLNSCTRIGKVSTTGYLNVHGYNQILDEAQVCSNVGENLVKCIDSKVGISSSKNTMAYSHCCLILKQTDNTYTVLKHNIKRDSTIALVSELPSFDDMCEIVE